nr:extracellular solute-binding protein [uncultured Rhodoferax sp.]
MAQRSSKFSWRDLQGSQIHFLSIDFGILKSIPALLPEFMAETGIEVTFEALPATEYRNRLSQAKSGDADAPDVYLQELDVSSYMDHRDGWSLDLTPLLNCPEMVCKDFDLAGLAPCMDAATVVSAQGRPIVLGIPFAVEAYILFYNKDILAQHGILPPRTMCDWVRSSKRIVEDSLGQLHGTVLRSAISPANIDVLTAMAINACDGPSGELPGNIWFNGSWSRPRADDPRILQAIDWYAQLLVTGPASYESLGCVAARNVFMEGRSAFFMDASLMVTDLEGDAISKFPGGVGCVPLPAAGIETASRTGHWMLGLGIPTRAKNVSAAWFLIQWLTHRKQALRLALDHGGPARRSLWAEPGLRVRFADDFVRSITIALETSTSTTVFHPCWNAMASAILKAVHQRMEGHALTQIGRELNETLCSLARGSNVT